uniref:NADH-ubiquinone oxidoreductase chain 4L n=1 Tax=Paracarsidara gigantea TaxID=2218136 RepID=A0A344A2L7_9HEMI|nr:NADH dehydrogenase subunit 4L [Paracarsidara gigantea]AWU49008.1 NADH dehydrogenase subunit 4L [Paracarsidara gigantea]
MLIFLTCMIMIYFGLKMILINSKHLLMILLTFEYMSLIIFLMLINLFMIYCYDISIMVYFMIVVVCESVLGLVLMTLVVRTHGSDYIKSLVLC